jgi:glutathione S-transferase
VALRDRQPAQHRVIIYHGAGSPFSWRVLLALEHKQLPYELIALSFDRREMHTPEFARINPREKVPALRDGELTLYESAAILEYLDDRHPEAPRLFPIAIAARAIVRRLVCEIDAYVGRHVSTLGKYVFRAAAEARTQPIVDEAADALREELGRFEAALAADHLAGDLGAADLSLYPLFAILARFELRRPDLRLSAAMGPRVARWMKRIEALPYFGRTYPAHWR